MDKEEWGSSKQLGKGADFSQVRLSMPDEFFVEKTVRGPAYARIRAKNKGKCIPSNNALMTLEKDNGECKGKLDLFTREDMVFIDNTELIDHSLVKEEKGDITTPPHIGPKSRISNYRNAEFILDRGSTSCNETVREQLAQQCIYADIPVKSAATSDRNERKMARFREPASLFQDTKSNHLQQKQALITFRSQIKEVSRDKNSSRKTRSRIKLLVGLPMSKLRRRFSCSLLQRSLNSARLDDTLTVKVSVNYVVLLTNVINDFHS